MPNNRLRIRQFDTAANAPAASRASWIGTLRIDDFSVPVKAFSAIASLESNLHLIHAGCGRRVSLRKICPKHGSLESTDVQRAFAYSSDLLVELSDDELATLNPVDDKTILIERFFSPDRLDLTLLAGRTLFLAPASLAAQQAFHLLVDGGPKRWRGGSVAAVQFGGALWRSLASQQDGGVSPYLAQLCREAQECEPIWSFGKRFVGVC